MAMEPVFSPRTVAVLIICGSLAFAGAAYFAIANDQPGTSGTNVYSTSAVGHRAFLELLQLSLGKPFC